VVEIEAWQASEEVQEVEKWSAGHGSTDFLVPLKFSEPDVLKSAGAGETPLLEPRQHAEAAGVS
jgi:hypothetical protein